ncbi:MAG: hypothetical protein A3F51_02680 [Candidatus Taylorbacteria bacterium RIFCSPHIGHO2_12_FULL_45_16]|uniref:DUF2130 domain-containing protein n=1 Tax=Candidatus Taylorbacteria bacterium RIFCSPHIGHO2_12_FULL_45_16 TaxID=1802315 RepID=A0A1G2MXK9_9BACT|nr:MAG: hypothetical protein A3F51_02680 [Candidatus Taylorbacteria bacterium RIFCSPHIGHO2_12_FULL_45_16]
MPKKQTSKLDEIKCPKCGELIPLSEALQHQITERIEYESAEKIGVKEDEIREREKELQKRDKELAQAKKDIDKSVEEGVKVERVKLEEELKEKAKEDAALEVQDLKNQVSEKEEKLKKAEQTELELRKRERALEERGKTLELEAERKLGEGKKKMEEDIAKRISEQHRLKEAERDKIINDLKTQLEDAHRKAEQGSQQLQGEAKELDLEKFLKESFPYDDIIPVPKGVRGADVIQKVKTRTGNICGTILWESKQTKSWSDGWVSKLKDDQREAKADIAAIATEVMPKDIVSFGNRGDIWITKTEFVFGLATLLRDTLIQVATTKLMSESKDEKVEILFRYLTGSEFRQKVEAVADAFVVMKTDLDKEKRASITRWAKQEKHLEKAIGSIAGMHGDLRGLIGSSMEAIPLLESGDENADKGESTKKKKPKNKNENSLL